MAQHYKEQELRQPTSIVQNTFHVPHAFAHQLTLCLHRVSEPDSLELSTLRRQ